MFTCYVVPALRIDYINKISHMNAPRVDKGTVWVVRFCGAWTINRKAIAEADRPSDAGFIV